MPGPIAAFVRLNPFKTPEAWRLATLFAVVYFAQGMWSLPNQTMAIVLKERDRLSASQVADFMLMSTIPWLIKPVYGLVSDFVPLFGRRRKSYFLLSSGLAAIAGLTLASLPDHDYWRMAGLFTAMGFGLAFTDVLTDALMVENGRVSGLTGAFQSVQWFAIYGASILVGVLGGYLASTRNLHMAFLLAACFPLISFTMATLFIREAPTRVDRAAFGQTWTAILGAARTRDVWLVAGFIFFFNFSPSFGPAFLYYQTDVLKFDQQFIGILGSLSAVGYMIGALIYAPLSRRLPLEKIILWTIGVTAVATFSYLAYRDRVSAIVIDTGFGVLAMLTALAFLDLAAKACPPHVEATFFALLMSVYNLAMQLSTNVGARLYDRIGFTGLVFVSAAMTASAYLLVPWVRIGAIETRARRTAPAPTATV
ncbi:MAG TPA: MFS transporter [Methylomirabilota bacterium]|jgi:predicted MFS family arabinose efflux permease